MSTLRKILKSNNGVALIIVLITSLVLSILTASAIYINMINTRQVVSQKEYYQAYYLAYSGVEIGYSALMNNSDLFYEFKNNANHTKTERIYYGEGNLDEIDITIKSSNDKKKVTITSTGLHKASGKSVTLTMYFPVDFPSLKKWE